MSFFHIYKENRVLRNHILGYVGTASKERRTVQRADYGFDPMSRGMKQIDELWDELLIALPSDALSGPSLDAECGRGLVLVKTAHLKEAKQSQRPISELTPIEVQAGSSSCSLSFGIDVFPSSDICGNHAFATCKNIYAEKLSSHVVLHSGTFFDLPFESDAFSLVTSSLSLNKLQEQDAIKAVHELGRVLRRGGTLVIVDIPSSSRFKMYVQALREVGLRDVRRQSAKSSSIFRKSPFEVLVAHRAID